MHVRIILATGGFTWVWSYKLAPVYVNLTAERDQSTPVKHDDLGTVVDYLLDNYSIVSLLIE